jgi:hypothetical protein
MIAPSRTSPPNPRHYCCHAFLHNVNRGSDNLHAFIGKEANMTADSLQKQFPDPNGRRKGKSKMPVDSL